jgi:protein TonB
MKALTSLLVCLFMAQFAMAQIDKPAPPPPPPPPPPPMPASTEIFKVVEEMPRFPGCEEEDMDKRQKTQCANKKMLEYVYTNLSYPQEAKDNGIEGTGVVQFVVQKDGTLSDIKIVRSIGHGTDEEMLRVMNKMSKDGIIWIPGKQRGKPVRVMFNLPIKFRL